MAGRMFDQPRRHRYTGTTEVVPVDCTVCPCCAATVADETVHTDALFTHAGYGATKTTTRRSCTACTWSQLVEVTETRPPRRPR